MQGIRVQHNAWQRSLLILVALVATLMVTASTLVLVRHFAGSGSSAPAATQGTVTQYNPSWPAGNGGPPFRPAYGASGSGARPAVHQ
jgi:hypothetical protein